MRTGYDFRIPQLKRLAEVNQEIDGLGCSVVAQYALLGTYDLLTIVEAPDNETIAHLSVDLSSRGTVHITTCPRSRWTPSWRNLGTANSSGTAEPSETRISPPHGSPCVSRSVRFRPRARRRGSPM